MDKKNYLILLVPIFLILFIFIYDRKEIVRKKGLEKKYCLNDVVMTSKELTTFNINTKAKKLMIVAHPDDETIWGSHGIYHDKYLVVCVTCGVSKRRVKEFTSVMNLTDDDYIMLGYPDLVKGVRSNWQQDWDAIVSDLDKILKAKDWDLVITHNPEGEYGHIHHKNTNKIVTELYDKKDKLYYFGRYYKKEELIPKEDAYRLSLEEEMFKKNVLYPEYPSQKRALNLFYSMVDYETWVSYNDWMNNYEK